MSGFDVTERQECSSAATGSEMAPSSHSQIIDLLSIKLVLPMKSVIQRAGTLIDGYNLLQINVNHNQRLDLGHVPNA